MTDTPLDSAARAMQAQPADTALRAAFYQCLADSELLLLIAPDSARDPRPQVFETSDRPVVLAFDSEDRLAGFAQTPLDWMSLPGRALVRWLAAQGLALVLNPGAPSEMLLGPDAFAWLIEATGAASQSVAVWPEAVFAPDDRLTPRLVQPLQARLATLPGLGDAAWLARARYSSGQEGHVLALAGVAPELHASASQALAEALRFADLDIGPIDLAFPVPGDPLLRQLALVGLPLTLPPRPEPPKPQSPVTPGRDPDRPPRLR